MTRDELAWLLIRFSGIILILLALSTIVTALPTFISMLTYSDPSITEHTLDKKSVEEYKRAHTRSTLSVFYPHAVVTLTYSAVGLYFLLAGKWVFDLITKDR